MKKKGEQMKTEGIFHDRAKPVLEVETDTAYQSVRTTAFISLRRRLRGADRSKFFLKHIINIDSYICISTHTYQCMHIYPIFMITIEKLSQFDFEIHKVGYHERPTVNRDIVSQ
jgi:hypothetical protein